jgi:hypothetical protein
MAELTPDERKAFKAFKKKLKSTQLDDDSRLGRGPLSGSGGSRVTAITPPSGFDRQIWADLVTKGMLRRDGSLFELVSWQS